jgi:hypothetical protein
MSVAIWVRLRSSVPDRGVGRRLRNAGDPQRRPGVQTAYGLKSTGYLTRDLAHIQVQTMQRKLANHA